MIRQPAGSQPAALPIELHPQTGRFSATAANASAICALLLMPVADTVRASAPPLPLPLCDQRRTASRVPAVRPLVGALYLAESNPIGKAPHHVLVRHVALDANLDVLLPSGSAAASLATIEPETALAFEQASDPQALHRVHMLSLGGKCDTPLSGPCRDRTCGLPGVNGALSRPELTVHACAQGDLNLHCWLRRPGPSPLDDGRLVSAADQRPPACRAGALPAPTVTRWSTSQLR